MRGQTTSKESSNQWVCNQQTAGELHKNSHSSKIRIYRSHWSIKKQQRPYFQFPRSILNDLVTRQWTIYKFFYDAKSSQNVIKRSRLAYSPNSYLHWVKKKSSEINFIKGHYSWVALKNAFIVSLLFFRMRVEERSKISLFFFGNRVKTKATEPKEMKMKTKSSRKKRKIIQSLEKFVILNLLMSVVSSVFLWSRGIVRLLSLSRHSLREVWPNPMKKQRLNRRSSLRWLRWKTS